MAAGGKTILWHVKYSKEEWFCDMCKLYRIQTSMHKESFTGIQPHPILRALSAVEVSSCDRDGKTHEA